jgi:chromate transporter
MPQPWLHRSVAESSSLLGAPHLQLPDVTTLRPVAVVIALVSAVLLFRVTWSVLRTLGVCAVLGLVAGLAGLPIT